LETSSKYQSTLIYVILAYRVTDERQQIVSSKDGVSTPIPEMNRFAGPIYWVRPARPEATGLPPSRRFPPPRAARRSCPYPLGSRVAIRLSESDQARVFKPAHSEDSGG